MRTQTTALKTGHKNRIWIPVAAGMLMCLLILTVWRFFYQSDFQPPPFETAALQGLPQPEASLNYDNVTAPTGFSVGLCGTMYQQQDSSLMLYLTNPKTNNANIRCEIRNEAGELLYQSGVLKPGEYLPTLTPVKELDNEAIQTEILIYGYEEDTWYSRGTIVLNNILQPY